MTKGIISNNKSTVTYKEDSAAHEVDYSLDIDVTKKYVKGHKITDKDRKKKSIYNQNKEKKRLERLRKAGIKKASKRCSDSVYDMSDLELVIDDSISNEMMPRIRRMIHIHQESGERPIEVYDPSLPGEPFGDPHPRRVQAIMRMANVNHDHRVERILETLKDFTAFAIELSLCRSWTDVAKYCSAMALRRINTAAVRDFFAELDEVQDQAQPSFDCSSWKIKINEFRSGTLTLKNTPGYNIIKKVLILFVFTGITNKEDMSKNDIGRMLIQSFHIFDRQLDIDALTAFDAILEIAEFTLGFLEIQSSTRDYWGFLFPKTSAQKLHTYRAQFPMYKQGTLYKLTGIKPEEFVRRVKALKVELELILATADMKTSLSTMYYTQYEMVLKLDVDIVNYGLSHKMREAPFGVLIYGDTDVGKSGTMSRLNQQLGRVLGVDVSPQEIWCPNETDPYDTSYASQKLYNFDDLGAISNMKDPMNSKVSAFLHILNTIPHEAIMAALEDKGRLWHSPKGVFCTSNLPDAGFSSFASSLDALKRRFVMVHQRVKKDHCIPGTRRLDKSKNTYTNGVRDDANEFAFYTVVAVGKAVRPVYEKEEGERWISGPEMFKELQRRAQLHMKQQHEFVTYENSRYDAIRCPACFAEANTQWCTCSEDEIKAVFISSQTKIEDSYRISQVTENCKEIQEDYNMKILEEDDVLRTDDIDEIEDQFLGMDINLSREDLGRIYSVINNRYVRLAFRVNWYINDFMRRYFRVPEDVWMYRYLNVISWVTTIGLWRMIFNFRSWRLRLIALFNVSVHSAILSFIFSSFFRMFIPHPFFRCTLSILISLWTLSVSMYRTAVRIVRYDTRRRIIDNTMQNPVPFALLGFAGAILFLKTLVPIVKGFMNTDTPKNEMESEDTCVNETIIPKDMSDVNKRKAEEDHWKKPDVDPLPAPHELKTMTKDHVIQNIQHRICWIELYKDDLTGVPFCRGNAFWVNHRYIAVSLHAIPEGMDSIRAKVFKKPGCESSFMHTILFNPKKDKDMDISFWDSTKHFTVDSIFRFLSDVVPRDPVSCIMITQRPECYQERTLLWKTAIVANQSTSCVGSHHQLNTNTSVGDCGSLVVSESFPHHVLGFHTGGSPGGKGVAFSLLKKDVLRFLGEEISPMDPSQKASLGLINDDSSEVANQMDNLSSSSESVGGFEDNSDDSSSSTEEICNLDKSSIISKTHESSYIDVGLFNAFRDKAQNLLGNIDFNIDSIIGMKWYDKDPERLEIADWVGLPMEDYSGDTYLKLSPEPHPRSCVNFLQDDDEIRPAQIHFFGEDKRFLVHPQSRVCKSILSDCLTELGFPREHFPPTFHSGRDHSKYLQLGTRNILPIPIAIIERSSSDYVAGIIMELDRLKYPKYEDCLSLYEALNGVEGDRFLKQIDEKTAAGLGYFSKKSEHLYISYDPETGKKYLKPKDYLRENIAKVMNLMTQRKIVSMFVRSSLKDEPALPGKVRLFGVLSLDFLLVGKMLFGRVVSSLYSIPTVSEMFQGISVVTSDWTEMYNHILAFEPNCVFEGDYSKYDTSFSGQLIREAGKCLIAIGETLGHSKCILVAMETYIECVALNAWMFNGNVFVVDGWLPSGCWITSVLGGLANSLLHRCVFYSYVEDWNSVFRCYVHLATLGDDSLGSTICSWYNSVTIGNYFGTLRMKYTPASKGGELVPFIPPHLATFGKRRWRWNSYIDRFDAPLAISSILRSLHNYMKSHVDPRTIAVQVVDSAILEFFRHGKSEYLRWQKVLIEVCESVEIEHMVEKLYWTYEDTLQFIYNRQFLTFQETFSK